MQGSIASYLRRHHLAFLALFVALSGSAIAAFDPIGSDGDVDACFAKKSGDLDLLKGKKCGKREKPVAWSAEGPRGPEGAEGPPGSPDTPQDVLAKLAQVDGPSSGLDADLLDGASGAEYLGPRAYGRVAGAATVSHAKGVAGATRPSTGIYCLDLPGLDPDDAPLFVGNDISSNFTVEGGANFSIVEWDRTPSICPDDQYEVRSFQYDGDTTDDDGTVGAGDAMTSVNQAFTFMVP